MYRISVTVLSVLLCSPVFAAHIVTETRVGDSLVERTDTYANKAGDLRIEERGYGSSVSSSAVASAGSSNANVQYHLNDKPSDVTLYQTNGEAIVSLEGTICRRMTADSAAPPGLGMPGVNLGEQQRQMADAMAQASAAMEEAMRQARQEGMTAEQQRELERFTQPFMQAQQPKPRDALQITPLNTRTTVGNFVADGYLVTDSDGVEKHRVWVVPASSIAGGEDVRNAMNGMMAVYEAYLEKIGGGALMDTGLATLFREGEFADKYPVRMEDLQQGEITDVIEAHSGGPAVDYYPDCEERDMMAF